LQSRLEILKIHASKITKHGDIDYEAVVKLGDGFNGADLRNICTEAGMFAIRDERDYVVQVRASRADVEVGGCRKGGAAAKGWGDGQARQHAPRCCSLLLPRARLQVVCLSSCHCAPHQRTH
jgi:SpoVK/Ycf46/Vps4 family AAA+-type ATPase